MFPISLVALKPAQCERYALHISNSNANSFIQRLLCFEDSPLVAVGSSVSISETWVKNIPGIYRVFDFRA